MLKKLLAFLAAYLTLGADPPEETPPPDEAPAEDSIDDLDLEGEEPPAPRGEPNDEPPDTATELRREREARARAERDAAEYRTRAEAAERARNAPPPVQNDEQRLYQQEEERLRATDLTEAERWQIGANRTLRASAAQSRQALDSAREMGDKADFDRLCTSSPLAKKYASRVEEKRTTIQRDTGNFLPRGLVLRMIVGDDIVEGRVKAKKREGGGEGGTRVPRNQVPVTRSDVGRRGGASEHEKRRARLADQNI